MSDVVYDGDWWVIHDAMLRALVQSAFLGQDPDDLIIELYANARHERDE